MAKETPLFHPSFGLKAMEASIYKGRPPRKGAAAADEAQVQKSMANSHVKGSFAKTREIAELKVNDEEEAKKAFSENERAMHVAHAAEGVKLDQEGQVIEREAQEVPHAGWTT